MVKDNRVLLLLILIILLVSSLFLYKSKFSDKDSDSKLGGFSQIKFSINYSSIDYPRELVYYKVVDEVWEENFSSQDLVNSSGGLLSEDEAILIAEDYIMSHGGLPGEAILDNVETQYVEKRTIGEAEGERIPLFVEVTYHRVINGTPVVGPGDFIMVTINEDGDVTGYMKSWRILEPTGIVDVISPEEATKKLKDKETIGDSSYSYPIVINKVYLGYYSQSPGEKQGFYKPVWVFQGVDYYGETIRLYVDAELVDDS